MDLNNANIGFGSTPKVSAPNPYSYPSEICEECGSQVFIPGVIFKKVPGVLMGAGVDIVPIPIKVAVCAKCGTLSPLDKQKLDEEEAKARKSQDTRNKSDLII